MTLSSRNKLEAQRQALRSKDLSSRYAVRSHVGHESPVINNRTEQTIDYNGPQFTIKTTETSIQILSRMWFTLITAQGVLVDYHQLPEGSLFFVTTTSKGALQPIEMPRLVSVLYEMNMGHVINHCDQIVSTLDWFSEILNFTYHGDWKKNGNTLVSVQLS